MKEKKTYNHAFDVAFQVPDSQYKDWEDCLKHEKQQVINALQRRVRELFEAKEYLEAISGFDTYEEEEGMEGYDGPQDRYPYDVAVEREQMVKHLVDTEIPQTDNSEKATKKVAIDND